MQLAHCRRGDVVERFAAGDAVITRHALERDLSGVDPDLRDLAFAAHGDIALGSAHHHDDVAVAIGRAEQHHAGSSEAGGDGDQMIGEICDQRLRARRLARRRESEAHEQQQEREPAYHSVPTTTIE